MKWLISFVAFVTLCVGFGEATTSLICGGSSSSKNIALINPSMPPKLCEYTIKAYSSYVCQLRIDFTMTLAQPSLPNGVNGLKVPECVNDYLQIGERKLCGVETSQHIYVPFNRSAGMKSLDISLMTANRVGGSSLPKVSWNLHVFQLECPVARSSIKDGYWVAPTGCDQYFPDGEGAIKSFNYNNGNGIFPYNLNYAICFRRTTATVGLLIKGSDFNLGNDDTNSTIFSQIDNSCYPQLYTEGRIQNYLMIPQATIVENNIHASYFCGQSIDKHSVLSTNPGPLMIVFNSNDVYQKGITAQGFSLKYQVLSSHDEEAF